MDVQDGFIVGIHNYCDRWCEHCRFTSRCRVFAGTAEADAAEDPTMKAVITAAPIPFSEPKRPAWLENLIQGIGEAMQASGVEDDEPPAIAAEHCMIEARAQDYGTRVYEWLGADRGRDFSDPGHPLATISWFASFIPAKVCRALHGLAEDDPGTRDYRADNEGSAKAALIAIERSHAAWLELVRRGTVGAADAEPFMAALVALGSDLERAVPNARAFVRPGFDEPDAVARLEATSGE
jgi:hypothetical protein